MIPPMRRWLLLVLVLLLPLRGLVGEAMAGEMLARATQQAQPAPQQHAAAHDCDHHGSAQGTVHHAPAPAKAQPADCPTCAACQVCSSVAFLPTLLTPAGERLSQAPPPAVSPAWRNAEPALAFKPPRG